MTTDFKKQFILSSQKVKETITKSIKNDKTYSNQLVDVKLNGDEIIYPSTNEITDWMKNLFENDLKSRNYSQQALDNMKLKGITPGKQLLDNLVIVVTSSDTDVCIGVSTPTNFTSNNNQPFVKMKLFDTIIKNRISTIDTISNTISIITCNTDFPFKEKDTIYQSIFNHLEEIGLYKVEKEEDDDICYTFDD
jgi:hypothetical protein